MSSRDSFKITDEGGGIIRVDAESPLVRKRMAVAMCDEVDKTVAGYDEFKILMNMSAMSKGTPAAGFYVMRSMKKYPLKGTALFGANAFMRGMATTVMSLARFSNFQIFQSEVDGREWLERGAPAPVRSGGMRRLALPGAVLAAAALIVRRRHRHA